MTRLDEIEGRAESMTRSGSGTMTVDVSDIRLLVAVARAALAYVEGSARETTNEFMLGQALVPLLTADGECLGPGCEHEWEQMDGTYDGWFCGHCGAERDDDPRTGRSAGGSL